MKIKRTPGIRHAPCENGIHRVQKVKISNPKESENRNGKGGTICRGIRDARLKISDKNFLCRQLGFDRHMHEDELEGQDFQTNWQNAGILMYPPVFINGMADSYQYDQYLFADRRNETNQINLRLTENVGRSGCHGHRTDLSLHCFTRYSHRSGHWTAWTSWSDCDPYDTSDEYSKHRGPQYQSRVRVCSTQVGLKSKLYIAECEGGNDFSDFFEMRKCDDAQEPTTEKSYTDWTTTQTQWHTSATHVHTTNPNPTTTIEPHEPDYEGLEMMSMINSSYAFEYSMSEINYDYYYISLLIYIIFYRNLLRN